MGLVTSGASATVLGILLFVSCYGLSAADKLYNQYDFVKKHAPMVWLANGEEYFPSSVDFILQHTHPEVRNGVTWAVTNEEIDDPTDTLRYFAGSKPNSDGIGPQVVALIIPEDVLDPESISANPLNGRVRVIYNTLYPYNRGKHIRLLAGSVIGSHVSDIEKCYVVFANTVPESIKCSAHSSVEEELSWSDPSIEFVADEETGELTHPVVYSAWGSHGLYFDEGTHQYNELLGLEDETSKGTEWKTWQSMNVVTLSDVSKAFSDVDGWEDINWLTDIYRWGNPERSCIPFVDECRLNDGPTGFLGKGETMEALAPLIQNFFVCGGNQANGLCVWPIGIYSEKDPHCAAGFKYSRHVEGCFKEAPSSPDDQCPYHCSGTEGSCGPMWNAHAHGNCFFGCDVTCMPLGVTDDVTIPEGAPTHFCCDGGVWSVVKDSHTQCSSYSGGRNYCEIPS